MYDLTDDDRTSYIPAFNRDSNEELKESRVNGEWRRFNGYIQSEDEDQD